MRINKLIFYTIFETIMLIVVVTSTYFIWDSFDNESKDIAYSYSNPQEHLTLNIENNISELFPLKDNKALTKNNLITLKLTNDGKIKKQYYIYLKINENTNLDTKYLKINLKEESKYLFTLENFSKNNERYYILESGIIKNNEEITRNLYLWLTEETPNSEQNKTFNFEINVEEM